MEKNMHKNIDKFHIRNYDVSENFHQWNEVLI